jgi:N-hydroxyarylamine O-acetyltransferase
VETNSPRLKDYFDRISYRGLHKPDVETLFAIHKAQAFSVPYEGIDVLAGLTPDHSIEAIFDKIVRRRRGGWCYETNGLLGWALDQVGFEVHRAVAGVYRKDKGDTTLGNHVVLLVKLDQIYLADLGLGDALREPLALREGEHTQGGLTFRLEKLPDGYWRFHNHALGSPTSFDFRDFPADEELLAAKAAVLRVDPESFFVQNFECIAMRENSSVAILGRVLRSTSLAGVEKQLIVSPKHMEKILVQHFGIAGVDVQALWPKILQRHKIVFGAEYAAPL